MSYAEHVPPMENMTLFSRSASNIALLRAPAQGTTRRDAGGRGYCSESPDTQLRERRSATPRRHTQRISSPLWLPILDGQKPPWRRRGGVASLYRRTTTMRTRGLLGSRPRMRIRIVVVPGKRMRICHSRGYYKCRTRRLLAAIPVYLGKQHLDTVFPVP